MQHDIPISDLNRVLALAQSGHAHRATLSLALALKVAEFPAEAEEVGRMVARLSEIHRMLSDGLRFVDSEPAAA